MDLLGDLSVDVPDSHPFQPVTDQNKALFIQRRLHFEFSLSMSSLMAPWIEGFYEVVPRQMLSLLTAE